MPLRAKMATPRSISARVQAPVRELGWTGLINIILHAIAGDVGRERPNAIDAPGVPGDGEVDLPQIGRIAWGIGEADAGSVGEGANRHGAGVDHTLAAGRRLG